MRAGRRRCACDGTAYGCAMTTPGIGCDWRIAMVHASAAIGRAAIRAGLTISTMKVAAAVPAGVSPPAPPHSRLLLLRRPVVPLARRRSHPVGVCRLAGGRVRWRRSCWVLGLTPRSASPQSPHFGSWDCLPRYWKTSLPPGVFTLTTQRTQEKHLSTPGELSSFPSFPLSSLLPLY